MLSGDFALMKQLLTPPEIGFADGFCCPVEKRTCFSQEGPLDIFKWKIRQENPDESQAGHSQFCQNYELKESQGRPVHPTWAEMCRFSIAALALRCPGEKVIRTLIEN